MRNPTANQRAWVGSNPLAFDIPPGAYVPTPGERRAQKTLSQTERERRRKARKAAKKARRQK